MLRNRILFVLSMIVFGVAAKKPAPITQAELERRLQEMVDSVAIGDATPWKKYYADDALIFDEKGNKMTKGELVADFAPMPKGYSGSIKVAKAESRIIGDTAILSYDLDESQTIFGQQLSARFHGTDTWMYRNGQWQVVATQILRYYADPAPGKIDAAKMEDYAGEYELTPGMTMMITVADGKLHGKRGERPPEVMIPEAGDVFFREGVEGRRVFRRGDDGKVVAMINRRNNQDVVWRKVK
jgi:ketosteroid isomerase-like protein